MTPEDLATVKNFVVRRPGYGMVEWEGQVDVRGANLDRIISIRPKDVSVYGIDEAEGTKPEEGTKLNRPAKITFYDVWPKSGPDAAKHIKERQLFRLKAKASQMGAEFVSYDMDNGIWKFRVAHFSRYCLDEDWSDDESLAQTPQQEVTQTSAMQVSDSEDVDEMETVINEKAERAALSLLESMQQRRVVSRSSAVAVDCDFGEIEGETSLEHYEEMTPIAYHNAPTFNVVVPEFSTKLFCLGGSVNIASSWTPSTKVWQTNSDGQLKVLAESAQGARDLVPLLQTHLDCCKQVFLGGEGAPPLFSLKSSCVSELVGDILPRFEAAAEGHLRHAFTLISHCCLTQCRLKKQKVTLLRSVVLWLFAKALANLCADDLAGPVGNLASLSGLRIGRRCCSTSF